MNTPAVVEVLSADGPVTVQDGGRPGSMHQGVPPGGALVPEWLARANRAVGNAWSDAALECYGALSLIVREGRVTFATEDGLTHLAQAGDSIAFEAPARRARAVGYVAFSGGGLDVPCVLGGRGTLPAAKLGGLEGRLVWRRDTLCTRGLAPGPTVAIDAVFRAADASVRFIAGPDLDADARTLLASPCTLGAARDRTGVRLQPAHRVPLHAASRPSTPMARGAIERTPAGELIVLGPDHPTTGGYPVVALVARADLGALFARPTHALVHFEEIPLETARSAAMAHARAWFG